MKERWIQNAITRPGRLRAYVRRVYGQAGFTQRGTIRMEILRELARRKDGIGRAARLAITLRRLK
ncbi:MULTISPECIES: hypothetical protein [Thermus]|uniref:Uncharacterized protein n=1 Tax=Thermus thermophilus TaxID=274 RepID=A0A3P4ARL8_THETH|nr:hypothetical protein [Thermus thermophilus]VCU53795.1 hypothetical protein TTHN1_01581 [Thermus thermophilus]